MCVRRVIVCRAAWLHGCSQPTISAVIDAMTPRKLYSASSCGRARATQAPTQKSQIDMPLRLFAPFAPHSRPLTRNYTLEKGVHERT